MYPPFRWEASLVGPRAPTPKVPRSHSRDDELEWADYRDGSGGPGDGDTMAADHAIPVDESGPAAAGAHPNQRRKDHGGGIYSPLSCGDHGSLHLFDKVDPAPVSGDQTTSIPPSSELLLFGELQRLDQPLIILVGANGVDDDVSSDPDWNARYGAESVAEDSQSGIG